MDGEQKYRQVRYSIRTSMERYKDDPSTEEEIASIITTDVSESGRLGDALTSRVMALSEELARTDTPVPHLVVRDPSGVKIMWGPYIPWLRGHWGHECGNENNGDSDDVR